MKLSVLLGYTLVFLFAAILVITTFAPESGTIEQQWNALCAGIVAAGIGAGCLLYGNRKRWVS